MSLVSEFEARNKLDDQHGVQLDGQTLCSQKQHPPPRSAEIYPSVSVRQGRLDLSASGVLLETAVLSY